MANGQQQDPNATQQLPFGVVPFVGGGQQQVTAPDIMSQIKMISQGMQGLIPQIPGGNVPYTPHSTVSPTMPVPPSMAPTQQNTQIRPSSGSLHDQRVAKQQSIGNLIGNMAGEVVNKFAQEKYQKNVKTINDAANYLQGIQNAQELKRLNPNDPQIQAMADEAIQRNTTGWKSIMSDEKTAKMVGKAFSYDFTDPESFNTPEAKAGQAAIKNANAQQKAGIAAVAPQDKSIDEILKQASSGAAAVGQMGQGISNIPGAPAQPQQSQIQTAQAAQRAPAMTPPGVNIGGQQQPPQMPQQAGPQVRPQNKMEQYLASRPTSLEVNPMYAAQQQFEQQMLRDIVTKLGPQAARLQSQTDIANAKNATTLTKDYFDNLAKINMNDKKVEGQLKQQYARNAGLVEQQRARAALYAQGIGNRSTAQNSGMMAMKDFQQISTAMDRAESDNAKIQNEIKRLEDDRLMAKSSGENQRAEYDEEQIRQNKARYDMNSRTIDSMGPVRDSLLQSMTAGGYKMDEKGGFSYDPQLAQLAFGGQIGGGQGPGQGGASGGAGATTPQSVAGMGGTGGAPYGATGQIGLSNNQQIDQWNPAIDAISKRYQIDPNLVASVIQIESGGKSDAISHTGATGLGQFTEKTGKDYGLMNDADRRNPVKNIEATAHYLSDLINKNKGDVAKAIGDYYGWKHPIGEPTAAQHIGKVLAEYQRRGGNFDPQSARFAQGDFSGAGETIKTPVTTKATAAPTTQAASKPTATKPGTIDYGWGTYTPSQPGENDSEDEKSEIEHGGYQ